MQQIRTLFCLTVCLLFNYSSKAQVTNPKKPNVIFFLVDDMGWQDTSLPFWTDTTSQNRKFRTPNMERLAASGQKFTNAYATPVCTPSRVSLMTGINAARHRVTNWTRTKDEHTDQKDSTFNVPDWNLNGLSPIAGIEKTVLATPLAQIFKDHGYYTVHCGKAHFAAHGTPGANPLNVGFVKNIGGSAAGNPTSYLAENNFGFNPEKYRITADIPNMKQYWGSKTFLTEDLTLEAMKAMDTAQINKKPFFLYMAHYAIHLPYDSDPRFEQRYLAMGLNKQEAAYCALVEGMDKSLGDLMDYLDKNNLKDNTIIVFMSDNGGFSHAPRQGANNSQNLPLRGGKGAVYEGGVREPMMVRWPGVTKAGSISSQYCIIEDFYPSLLEMAGIKKYKTIQKLDGLSIVPYLKDHKAKQLKKNLLWNYPNNWAGGQLGVDNSFITALRAGDWKIVYYEKYQKIELYNLKDDLGEQHDLSKILPVKTKQMAKLLTKELKSHHAQLPTYKATGKTALYPNQAFALHKN